MLALEMLDAAIGLIFIYLLLSLVCSAVNELLEGRLKMRAIDLEQGIRELLRDYTGEHYAKRIYEHPLVYGLFRGKYEPERLGFSDKEKEAFNSLHPQQLKKKRYPFGSDLPSYIPARNFALALMEVLLPATQSSQSGATGAVAPTRDSLPLGPGILPVNSRPLQPLRDAAASIQGNDHLKTALLTVIDAAGDDVTKARENIENWYNSAMDRVSGWYKRRVQRILFFMGFLITLILNVDTFAVFRNLVNDRPLRNAVVATAQQFTQAHNENRTDAAPPKDNSDSLQAATSQPNVENGTAGQFPAFYSLKKNINMLVELGLPIGWAWKSALNNSPNMPPNYYAIPVFQEHTTYWYWPSIWTWFLKIMGWLVTGFAISLGASFWFDTLNKIMVVRSTVKPTEKSPEEASEDRQRS